LRTNGPTSKILQNMIYELLYAECKLHTKNVINLCPNF
jgi:hypothetical protein